jgi:putative ABC transport system substrate-binding protein
MSRLRRREFVWLLGGAAAWPVAAKAQQAPGIRRIGVLMDLPEGNRSRPRVAAFARGLADLGWTDGRDIQIDIRWGANAPEVSGQFAAELLTNNPEVVLASGSPATIAIRQKSAATPLVFVLVTDPVGAGLVDSLARPGTGVTGFTLFEYAIAGKWLQLLKEIAPNIRRAAVLRDLGVGAGTGQLGAIQAAAPSGGGSRASSGERDCRDDHRRGSRRQGCDLDNPHCLLCRARYGPDRACGQLEPSGWQSHRRQQHVRLRR